jgi:arsenate reductase
MPKPTVLFACVHNAGRSQMAAGWARHLGEGRIVVDSGGAQPTDRVNDAVVEAMAEVGIDIAGQRPRSWSEEAIRAADVVVTMGCGDTCPVFPGKRYLDWQLPDPSGLSVEEIRPIRDAIETKVRELLDDLIG